MKTALRFPLFCLCLCLVADRAQSATPLEAARQLNDAFADAAERVLPCVVVLTVTEKPRTWNAQGEQSDRGNDPTMPEFWRRFNHDFEEEAPEVLYGQGSGIIIRTNGYILTNRHVVDGADTISVRLMDGRRFTASIRGVDPQSDIAVLKIEADALPAARFADSAKVRIGEFAIAIGAPFSLEHTVTFGHVSATGRANVIPWFMGGTTMDQEFIQTDANINPGSSGGPLINIEGEVIGMNTLIRGPRSGIGFAIPSNLAVEIANKIIEHGKIDRPWLGIEIQALRDTAEFQDVASGLDSGVVVRAILANSPAAQSELRPADIIVAIDNDPVATPQQLRTALRRRNAGESITLTVRRGDQTRKVTVTPQSYPEPSRSLAAKAPVQTNQPEGKPDFGLTVRDLTNDVSNASTRAQTGVVVQSLDETGPAARGGLQPGDIITALNWKPVNNTRQFKDTLDSFAPDKAVVVQFIRRGTARFETLRAERE